MGYIASVDQVKAEVPEVNREHLSKDTMDKVRKEEINAMYRGYGKREVDFKRWEVLEDEKIWSWRRDEVKKAVERMREDHRNHTVPLQGR